MKLGQARVEGKKSRLENVSVLSFDAAVKQPVKMSIYGDQGTGKTYLVVGLLLSGEKVFTLSTDLGGNGLLAVVNELKRLGRTELLENLKGIDLNEYKDVDAFLKAPDAIFKTLPWKPTVIFWDGFSSFNVDTISTHVASLESSYAGAGALRDEGLKLLHEDWTGVKRATIASLRAFIALQVDGQPVHKVLTSLQGSRTDNNPSSSSTQIGPFIQGTGRTLVGIPFDVVINTYSEEENEEINYYYRNVGDSSKFVCKNRGFDLPPVMKADPQELWKRLTK